MEKIKKLLSIGTIIASLTAPAFADDTPATPATDARKTVTSKKYVDDVLDTKQDKIGNQGDNGSVVIYTENPGTVSAKPIYSEQGAYNNTTKKNLIEAENVNTAIKNGLKEHIECVDDNLGPNGECWLWVINEDMNGTYIPHNQ